MMTKDANSSHRLLHLHNAMTVVLTNRQGDANYDYFHSSVILELIFYLYISLLIYLVLIFLLKTCKKLIQWEFSSI